jgi:hypothetical protein
MHKIWASVSSHTVYTVICFRVWVLASGLWVHSPAAHSRILSGKSIKVRLHLSTTEKYSILNNQTYLGSVGLVSRFGHFYRAVDPGLVQVNVCTESLKIVDVKIQIAPIGRQT